MSSDYYFKQWKKLLQGLKHTVDVDKNYQTSKTNDKKLCDVVQRLSGILGKYIFYYNQLVECAKMNLQVQKTKYIEDLIQSVVARVVELQNQINKLDGSSVQFLSKSLIDHKLTTDDVELTDIPQKMKRPDHVQEALHESMRKAEEEKKRLEEEENQATHSEASEIAWWRKESVVEVEEEKLDDKELELQKRKDLLNLIAAHEKTRQILIKRRKYKSKREKWAKELQGTLQPPARFELRERAAQFIKRFARAYFEVKRKKNENCKRDNLLGYTLREIPRDNTKLDAEKIALLREQKRKEYESEWNNKCEEMKSKLYKKVKDNIAEDYRDDIRDWFQTWYKEAKFFYGVPSKKKGGSALILKEELPSPNQWLEEYKSYQAKKNNPQNVQRQKQEKLAIEKAEQSKKKAEKAQHRMEAALLRKSMKKPGEHPGYTYPVSEKINHIFKALECYHKDWDSLDAEDTLNVKERYVTAIDESNVLMEIKMEVRTKVDEHMRIELKKLRVALKEDYKRQDVEMPVMISMIKRKRKAKKNNIINDPFNSTIPEKLQKLILRGYLLQEYPRIQFEDIMGDPNFAGEDLKAQLITPIVIGAETRRSWWGKCRKVTEGFQRVLLTGPKGSGKTTLAYVLATVNDAVFFDLDPDKFIQENETMSEDEMQELIPSLIDCAKAMQPAVIYIKHIQRFYCKKAPTKQTPQDQELMMRCVIKPMLKNIEKTDNITVIGTCVDPWLTKSKQIWRHFPNVILTPDTSYSLTYEILRTWMAKNRAVPTDLDVHTLAYMLKGYSFDFLTKTLQAFLTADQIIKIAAKGLFPEEVYNFVTENDREGKPDYGKYLDWYSKRTPQGRSEQKHLAKQQTFLDLERQWQEKMAKAKKTKPGPLLSKRIQPPKHAGQKYTAI